MQERQVRVVADAKDVRLRTLRCGQLFPGGLVPRRNLAILDGPACGSAITEQDEITAAVSTSSALLQAFVQHMLHIRAAAQPAGTNEIQSALNGCVIRGYGRGLKKLRLLVKQEQIETIRGSQRAKQRFQRLIAALQFLPLHRKRSIEEKHDGLCRTRVLHCISASR